MRVAGALAAAGFLLAGCFAGNPEGEVPAGTVEPPCREETRFLTAEGWRDRPPSEGEVARWDFPPTYVNVQFGALEIPVEPRVDAGWHRKEARIFITTDQTVVGNPLFPMHLYLRSPNMGLGGPWSVEPGEIALVEAWSESSGPSIEPSLTKVVAYSDYLDSYPQGGLAFMSDSAHVTQLRFLYCPSAAADA